MIGFAVPFFLHSTHTVMGERELLGIHGMPWNVSPVAEGTWSIYLAASVLKAGQRKLAVGGYLLKTLLLNPLAFSLQTHSP